MIFRRRTHGVSRKNASSRSTSRPSSSSRKRPRTAAAYGSPFTVSVQRAASPLSPTGSVTASSPPSARSTKNRLPSVRKRMREIAGAKLFVSPAKISGRSVPKLFPTRYHPEPSASPLPSSGGTSGACPPSPSGTPEPAKSLPAPGAEASTPSRTEPEPSGAPPFSGTAGVSSTPFFSAPAAGEGSCPAAAAGASSSPLSGAGMREAGEPPGRSAAQKRKAASGSGGSGARCAEPNGSRRRRARSGETGSGSLHGSRSSRSAAGLSGSGSRQRRETPHAGFCSRHKAKRAGAPEPKKRSIARSTRL